MRSRLFAVTLALCSVPFVCAFVVILATGGPAQNVVDGLSEVIPHAAFGPEGDQPAFLPKVVRYHRERGPFAIPEKMRAPGRAAGAVYIVPLGKVSRAHLELAERTVRFAFGYEDVRTTPHAEVPEFAYHPVRKRYRSDLLVDMLLRTRPTNAVRLVGITDVRLYSDKTHDVLGMAYLGKPATIISLHHLRADAAEQLPKPDDNESSRGLYKLLVHEMGHTFGLAHCSGALPCVMRGGGSRHTEEGPMWSSSYCDSCMVRFRRSWYRTNRYDEFGRLRSPM